MNMHRIMITALAFVCISQTWAMQKNSQELQQSSANILSLQQPHAQKKTVSFLAKIFGFDAPQQEEALTYIAQRAGVLQPGQSLDERFSQGIHAVLKWVKATQTCFVGRKAPEGGKFLDRWQVPSPEWMKEDTRDLQEALGFLGFVHEVKPVVSQEGSKKHPVFLCVLGASKLTVDKRVAYAETLAKELHYDAIIFLGGERFLQINPQQKLVDGSLEDLDALALKCKKELKQLTETDLLMSAYDNSHLKKDTPVYFIDTPRGDLPRPTTQTTVLALVEFLGKKGAEKASLHFVSNQPYVMSQKSTIEPLIPAAYEVQVVGPAMDPVNIQAGVECLGGCIWASTPDLLVNLVKESGQPLSSEDSHLVEELFGHNAPIMEKLQPYMQPRQHKSGVPVDK